MECLRSLNFTARTDSPGTPLWSRAPPPSTGRGTKRGDLGLRGTSTPVPNGVSNPRTAAPWSKVRTQERPQGVGWEPPDARLELGEGREQTRRLVALVSSPSGVSPGRMRANGSTPLPLEGEGAETWVCSPGDSPAVSRDTKRVADQSQQLTQNTPRRTADSTILKPFWRQRGNTLETPTICRVVSA